MVPILQVPKGFRRDYWQIDHLAGGPLRSALERANASAAAEFGACLQRSKRTSACFRTTLKAYPTPLVSWREWLSALDVREVRRHRSQSLQSSQFDSVRTPPSHGRRPQPHDLLVMFVRDTTYSHICYTCYN